MFGLTICRHSVHIQIPENETYDSLVSLLEQSLSFIHCVLNRELAHFQTSLLPLDGASHSHVDPRLLLLYKARAHHLSIYRDFVTLRDFIVKAAEATNQLGGDDTSISQFFPSYRGFFLTSLHKFVSLQGKLCRLFHFRAPAQTPKYISILKEVTYTLKQFSQLMSIGVEMERTNWERIREFADDVGQMSQALKYPYNSGLDLKSIEFDFTLFYQQIGTHYVKNARAFFELYVGMLAGMYDTIQKYSDQTPSCLRISSVNVLAAGYLLSPKRRARKTAAFAANDEAFETWGNCLWNAMDLPWVQPLAELTFPPIAVSKRFEVSVPDDLRRLEPPPAPPPPQQSQSEEEGEVGDSPYHRSSMTGAITREAFDHFLEDVLGHGIDDSVVSVRLISSFPLKHRKLPNERSECAPLKSIKLALAKGVGSLKKICVKSPGVEFMGDVIFHIHGGGFIAMSSHSHEMYLRRLSKQLKMPVISVDYTNAPAAHYPTQLLQCFVAYQYVVEHAKNLFGKPLRRIVFVGDSAGGNLCVALTILLIGSGLRKPDAVVALYPSLMMSYEGCPSRVMAFVDPLVSKPFLEICLKKYPPPPGSANILFDSDPFISPVACPDEILLKFPPTYLSACSPDPLFDDSVAFAKRLDGLWLSRGIPSRVRLVIQDGLPHGYMNFCDLLSESRLAIRRIGMWIADVIHEFWGEPSCSI